MPPKLKEILEKLEARNVNQLNAEELIEIFHDLACLVNDGLDFIQFENLAHVIDNDYRRLGIRMLVDGVDIQVYNRYMQNRYDAIVREFPNMSKNNLTKLLIVKEGLIEVYSGSTPWKVVNLCESHTLILKDIQTNKTRKLNLFD